MKCTIKDNLNIEITVMKSKFIAYIFPIVDDKKPTEILDKLRKEHMKARHICYAYKVNGKIKFSDDGEPSGTAGKPILNIIEQNNLDGVLLCVVRYFGGTLLGSGRLLRTYVEAAKEVTDKVEKYEIIEEKIVYVELDISVYDLFLNYLKINHFHTHKIQFNDKILLSFYAPLDYNDDIKSRYYGNLELLKTEVVTHLKGEC